MLISDTKLARLIEDVWGSLWDASRMRQVLRIAVRSMRVAMCWATMKMLRNLLCRRWLPWDLLSGQSFCRPLELQGACDCWAGHTACHCRSRSSWPTIASCCTLDLPAVWKCLLQLSKEVAATQLPFTSLCLSDLQSCFPSLKISGLQITLISSSSSRYNLQSKEVFLHPSLTPSTAYRTQRNLLLHACFIPENIISNVKVSCLPAWYMSCHCLSAHMQNKWPCLAWRQ